MENDDTGVTRTLSTEQPWARSLDVSAISKISSRVESRVESRLALRKSSSSTRIFEAYLTRSLVELSQVLLDFTRLVPYTRLVEGMDTLSSRDTRVALKYSNSKKTSIEYGTPKKTRPWLLAKQWLFITGRKVTQSPNIKGPKEKT